MDFRVSGSESFRGKRGRLETSVWGKFGEGYVRQVRRDLEGVARRHTFVILNEAEEVAFPPAGPATDSSAVCGQTRAMVIVKGTKIATMLGGWEEMV